MKNVRVEWVPGSRSTGFPENTNYYPVSKFPDDQASWSVVLALGELSNCAGKIVSYGTVRFLMDNAPDYKFAEFKTFEIYEGPRKVADVFILED